MKVIAMLVTIVVLKTKKYKILNKIIFNILWFVIADFKHKKINRIISKIINVQ